MAWGECGMSATVAARRTRIRALPSSANSQGNAATSHGHRLALSGATIPGHALPDPSSSASLRMGKGAAIIRPGWLLDSHVHLHSCFAVDRFVSSAAANFRTAAARLKLGSGALGCIVLTDTREQRGFERLYDLVESPSGGEWSIELTLEDCSLLVKRGGEPVLGVIAGRQITTREGLEILTMGCTDPLEDGLPIDRALAHALRHSAVVILPWGFGKWTLRRGMAVKAILDSEIGTELFVGDNGNRPSLVRAPQLLRVAADRGILTLVGSDPLPLPSHSGRAGQVGNFLPCVPDWSAPARQIESLLRTVEAQPETFRTPEPLIRFARSQLSMQVRKRRRRAPRGEHPRFREIPRLG